MAEEIFSFYKNELGIYNMVFKHMKVLYWISILLPIVVFGGIIILKIINIISNVSLYWSILILGVIHIIFIFGFVNYKIKNITMQFYKKKSKKFMWSSDYEVISEIRQAEENKLIEYLKKNSFIKEIDAVKWLQENETKILLESINTLKNQLKHSRYKGFIMPSIFGALFISLWNNFFGWVYNIQNTTNVKDAVNILVGTTLAIFVFIGLFMMLKSIFNLFTEDIFNRDYRRICECQSLLKGVYNNYKRMDKCQN